MFLFACAKSHFTSRDDGHISRLLVSLVHVHPSSSVRQYLKLGVEGGWRDLCNREGLSITWASQAKCHVCHKSAVTQFNIIKHGGYGREKILTS